jgi:hypothetical protein
MSLTVPLSLLAVLVVVLLFIAPRGGEAGGAPPVLPEGDVGLAARYPRDAGIETDPAVVFHADFEDCQTVADLHRSWSSVIHEGNMRIAEEAANVHGGRRSLELTLPRQNEPLAVGVDRSLSEGQDLLFLRFYAKIQDGFDVPMCSIHNGASVSAGYWQGESAGPGKPADGRNKFLVNFEADIASPTPAPSPGPLNIYIYHPEQRDIWGDHFYPNGVVVPNTSLPYDFGPHFVPRPDFVPELGRWYCYEYMVKANTPGQRDGRIACWVDGRLIADFPNLRLRDVETLKIDLFGVGLYIANNSRRENKKWYDDIVAATSYIGPRLPGAAR